MKTLLRILTLILLLGLFALNAYSETETLTSIADTYVASGAPNQNFGTENSIYAGTQLDIIGYLRYNLSSLPSNISIQYARLRLYCPSSISNTGLLIITQAANSWSESTLTWNTPHPNGVEPFISFNAPGTSGWWTIDVTSIVKEWLEKGEPNYGFRFEKGEAGLIQIRSKESTSYAPQLIISYEVNRFTASGTVTGSINEGVGSVRMSFSRISGSGSIPSAVYTGAQGTWSQSDFEEGTTYRVTPSHGTYNYVFNPPYRNFDGSDGNETGLNFTTTTAYSVSFTSIPNGATVSTSGYADKITPCTFTGLVNTKTFTISKEGYNSESYDVSYNNAGQTINIVLDEIKPLAEIVDFVVPTGTKVRGTSQTVHVSVKNNGDITRSFWVGLSFAHEAATWENWPLGWNDIKPQETKTLVPGEIQEIVFSFIIPNYSNPGQYYAVCKTWNNFNSVTWLMEDPVYDESIKHSVWNDSELGETSYILGPFDTPPDDIIGQLLWGARFLAFDGQDLMNSYINEGKKPLLYFNANVQGNLSTLGVPLDISAGATFLIDLDDLFQFTPEGQFGGFDEDGWVTMWIDAEGELGLGADLEMDIGGDIGITYHNFNYFERALADDRRTWAASLGAKIPGFAITLVEYRSDGGIQKPSIHWTGSAGISLNISGNATGLVSWEVNVQDLLNAFRDAFSNNRNLYNSIYRLSQNLYNMSSGMFRKATWDDGSWQLADGTWESYLKLSEQYDSFDDEKFYAHHFYIDVPVGTRSLNVVTGVNVGAYGNVDLYLKHNSRPDLTGLPYSLSSSLGNSESINIQNPSEGRWYIMLPSITPYDMIRVNASLDCTPSQPGVISGPNPACIGSSQTYTISPVTGATSYTWTLPSGWSGSSTTTSITATAGASGGPISVKANNSCGSSTPRTLSVSVTTIPAQPGSITGSTSVCQGSSQTYSITAVSGAASYTWTLPSGWSGSSTTNSIIATVGTTGGIISVTANNTCGSSAPRTLSVSVTAIPAQPGAITGSTSVCQGSSQTYSISSVTGATSYTWTLPSGWSGSSTTNSIIATVGATGGTISVTANNNCGLSLPRTFNVVIASKPTVETANVNGATNSTATGGGTVTSNGGADIIERGVCWSINSNPTINDSKSSDGTSIGSFTSTITDLTNGVTYHIRAFATNCSGTGYGLDIPYFHNTTDMHDIQYDEISIYPNPVTDILNIEYKNDNYETINIFNSQGILLEQEKVNSPRQQLDFSKFEYGLYILEFVRPGCEKIRVKVINH